MAWTGGSGVALVCEGLTGRGRAVLQRAIRRAGWTDGQFWVCRAGDIPAGARALVAMGAGPLKALTGFEGGKRAVEYVRGYELPSWTGLPVVPTFDPERVAMGQMKLLGLVMNDVGLALRAARKPNPVLDPKAMVDAKVGLQALRDLYAEAQANPQLCIAADLETKESSEADEDDIMEFSRDDEDDDVPPEDGLEGVFEQGSLDVQRADITTVQFSLRPMTGVSCDWSDEAAQLTQAFMDLPNEIAFQNGWHFDEPILRNHGIRIPENTHDTRWMAHCLQPDLPKHLQGIASWFSWPFPWKHFAGSDLAFYGVIDVAVVQHLMIHLPRALKQLGLWDAYLRYVKEFRPVLADMERRGIPVNREKLGELRGWLDTEVRRMDGDLQLQVPPHLIGCSPPKGYDNLPQEIKPIVTSLHADLLAPTVKQLKNGKTKEVASKIKGQDLYRMLVTGELPNSTLELCLAQGFEIKEFNGQGRRLYKRVDFNARSPKQIVEYIKARNWPVPTRFRDGKDTTGDKELAKLEARTKDPSLGLIRNIRAYSKMENAYAGKIGDDGQIVGGWQPGPDGRLRSTMGFGPATGQLNAKNPNTMTLPKRRKELAQRFRRCIEAPPGYVMIEFDYKAFHSLTTALESKDRVMYRLAPLDPHSFVTGHMVKYPGIETCLSLSDDDLVTYLKEIRKAYPAVRDFQAKPASHGTNFGQKARRLYFEYSEHFANEAAARKLLDLMGELFPDLFKWQKAIVERADDYGQLISRWGFCRRFFDAMKWERDYKTGEWVRKPSKGAPAAMAFFPSNDAHIMLRKKILEIYDRGWTARYGLVQPVHDAIWFCCPPGQVDNCLTDVKEVLESPVMELADPDMCPDGFVCKVDAMVGPNLGDLEEVK